MKEEVHQLADEQVKAIITAALSSMTKDEYNTYERRHERMRGLLGTSVSAETKERTTPTD